jgi:hypothetical protein
MGEFDDLEKDFDAFLRLPPDDGTGRGKTYAARRALKAHMELMSRRNSERAARERRIPHAPSLAHGKTPREQSGTPG